MVGKLYRRVMIKSVMDETECAIGDERCGFRRGKGCLDQKIFLYIF